MLPSQLRKAIKDVLIFCLLKTDKKIIDMLVGTACVESNCGQYLAQINGPACGIFQMEPNTAIDIYRNYIKYKQTLKHWYDKLYNSNLSLEDNLKYNLPFSIFMCRIHYMRIPKSIPESFEEQANYWKTYYNTKLGKGTVEDYIKKGKTYGDF